ncbi:hypothetical protein [Nostoc sp.]|uniref:hypothetical protein n=1 Tax=Nostoc sp. TaxID=1180 RepID=UPI002FF6CC23
MGTGDWGLGTGDWGLVTGVGVRTCIHLKKLVHPSKRLVNLFQNLKPANPQSLVPNPQCICILWKFLKSQYP